jgi:hypothetical protein
MYSKGFQSLLGILGISCQETPQYINKSSCFQRLDSLLIQGRLDGQISKVMGVGGMAKKVAAKATSPFSMKCMG